MVEFVFLTFSISILLLLFSCNDAYTLGASLKVPVYKFVKEALIRKFGKHWYAGLEKVATKY